MFFTKRFLLFAIAVATLSCNEVNEPTPTAAGTPVISKSEDKNRIYNLDKSPMDMIYFPGDFPVLKMSGKAEGDPVARVIYSRPSKDGRQIFGDLVKYGTYWRLGANESTEIEFFTDVRIKGKKVKEGRYILYCIPYENKWTLKFNSDLYTWGLRIHSNRDVYSFDVPVTKANTSLEILTMKFQDLDSSRAAQLLFGWDSVRASLPFNY